MTRFEAVRGLRHRTKVIEELGSRTARLATAFKPMESAQIAWMSNSKGSVDRQRT